METETGGGMRGEPSMGIEESKAINRTVLIPPYPIPVGIIHK